jgi:hypothetical protein
VLFQHQQIDWAACTEILCLGFDKNTETRNYFVAGKQVCKNFYCRARGMHRTTVEKFQREFLAERRSFLSAVERDLRIDGSRLTEHPSKNRLQLG